MSKYITILLYCVDNFAKGMNEEMMHIPFFQMKRGPKTQTYDLG